MNFFAHQSAAERYAKYRPYFHPLVIEKIKNYLHLERPVPCALDVGCGSGHSTVALKQIAFFSAGVDVSQGMLRFAERQSGIAYIQGVAETLAFKSWAFDLLTTSMAYHWFDQEKFLAEARRVLKPEAWLIIFNNGFTGQVETEPEFEQWVLQIYEKRYPTPPRNVSLMTAGVAQRHGFIFVHQEEYQNEVLFTVEELAAYLSTQSNVIAATEQGDEKVETVFDWLVTQTRPFFKREKVTFPFGGYIWYCKKLPERKPFFHDECC
jgi:ubiquinone/menaquinone biosynthesis C-methylase UbiE